MAHDPHALTSHAICPYCGHVERDSWEIRLSDGYDEGDGNHDCGACGKTYHMSRRVTVEYRTRKIEP